MTYKDITTASMRYIFHISLQYLEELLKDNAIRWATLYRLCVILRGIDYTAYTPGEMDFSAEALLVVILVEYSSRNTDKTNNQKSYSYKLAFGERYKRMTSACFSYRVM